MIDEAVVHGVVDGLTEGPRGLEAIHLGGLHAGVTYTGHDLA